MIFLLNYLPWFIIACTAYLMWRYRSKFTLIEAMIIIVLLIAANVIINSAQTSYGHKGTVAPLGNPAFDAPTAEVQDRLRKPGRDSKEAAEFLKEQSDWRKINAERQKEKQQ